MLAECWQAAKVASEPSGVTEAVLIGSLSLRDGSGEETREHPHYLKGSLYCHCGFRMIVSHSRGRHGTVYPCFCCLGRHGKHNNCTKKVVLIETIEENVQDLYTRVQLAPELRDAIELTLIEELDAISEEARLERTSLEKRQARLLAEQAKLLRALRRRRAGTPAQERTATTRQRARASSAAPPSP